MKRQAVPDGQSNSEGTGMVPGWASIERCVSA